MSTIEMEVTARMSYHEKIQAFKERKQAIKELRQPQEDRLGHLYIAISDDFIQASKTLFSNMELKTNSLNKLSDHETKLLNNGVSLGNILQTREANMLYQIQKLESAIIDGNTSALITYHCFNQTVIDFFFVCAARQAAFNHNATCYNFIYAAALSDAKKTAYEIYKDEIEALLS